MGAGFSSSDVETLASAEDQRLLGAVLNAVDERRRTERIIAQLDVAEAVNAAMVGATYDPLGRNSRAFGRWLRGKERRLLELAGLIVPTVWDTMTKSKKLGR